MPLPITRPSLMPARAPLSRMLAANRCGRKGTRKLSSYTHGEGWKLGRLRVSLSTLAALREPRRTSGHEARKGRASRL